MELTLLPLGLPGNIYRSPMPYGQYDPTGVLYQAFRKNEIHTVVLLVPDAECWVYAGMDLRKRYLTDGINVIHLPMKDYRGIDIPTLTKAVDDVLELAGNGLNVDIHCHAGLGRTGLFAACLARRRLGMSGGEAIHWIRVIVPGSVESDEQEQVIRAFLPDHKSKLTIFGIPLG
jgi:protein-tyrosine phosphatase